MTALIYLILLILATFTDGKLDAIAYHKPNFNLPQLNKLQEVFPEVKTRILFYENSTNSLLDYILKDHAYPTVISTKRNYRDPTFKNMLGFAVYSVVVVNSLEILRIVEYNLREIHFSRIFLIICKDPKNFFNDIWFSRYLFAKGFVYSAVYNLESSELYSLRPFPEPHLTKIESNSKPFEIFKDRMKNFEEFEFKVPIKVDPPRVLFSKKTRRFTGTGMELFNAFLKRHNGKITFIKQNLNDLSYFQGNSDCVQLLKSEFIDVCVNAFGTPGNEEFSASYPFFINDYCFVLPLQGEVPKYMYLVLPFTGKMWLLIITSFVSICLIEFLVKRICINRNQEFGPIFSKVLAHYIRVSPSPGPRNKNKITNAFGVIEHIFGFILSNIYLTFLATFLSTPVPKEPPNTLEDIYRSGIKVIIPSFESKLLEKLNYLHESKYSNIFYKTSMDKIVMHRKTMDRSFGFLMTRDKWEFYMTQQRELHISEQRFYVSKVCPSSFYLWFPIRIDSPFKTSLDRFIYNIFDTGLYWKWRTDAIAEGFRSGFLEVIHTKYVNPYEDLLVEQLRLLWYFYLVAMWMSILVFLIELLRFRSRQKRRFN